MSIYDFQWVKNYDPNNRWLVGKNYIYAKRIMDIALVIGSSPIWLLVILGAALAIWIESPGHQFFLPRFVLEEAGSFTVCTNFAP